MSRPRIVSFLVLALSLLGPVSLRAVGPPAVAFSDVNGDVILTDADGLMIDSFGNLNNRYSLGGSVVAGLKSPSKVVVFDATTSEKLSEVKSALSPVAIAGGKKVAFTGNFKRDHQVNSLWVHNLATGKSRKVVQFSTGGPGVQTGFKGENSMLEASFDSSATTAVVVQGNDLSLFIYDAWSINMKTGKATRLTKGKRSRHASISPDGHHVALFRQNDDPLCGGPPPGYRSGDLVVMNTDGTDKTVLADGNCDDVFYDDPRWLDDDTLVARRLTFVMGEELRDSELVFIDGVSGAVTGPFTTTKRVGSFTVSPELALVAYDDFVGGGFYIYDVASSMTRFSADGTFPHLSGEHRTLF
jgi:hypothetical protein